MRVHRETRDIGFRLFALPLSGFWASDFSIVVL